MFALAQDLCAAAVLPGGGRPLSLTWEARPLGCWQLEVDSDGNRGFATLQGLQQPFGTR